MNTIVLPRTAGRRCGAVLRTRAALRATVRDRVVMVFALSLAALGVLDTTQVPASLRYVAGALIGIAPFIALAVAIAAYAAAIAVWALVRRSVFALHLVPGLGGSVLAGVLYQSSGAPI